MDVIASQIKTDSKEFATNRDRMLALVAELRDRLARAREGGGAKYLERHRKLGKLPVRDRINQLTDANTPFLELSALAATDMYDNEAPAAGIVTGIGRVSHREVVIVVQDFERERFRRRGGRRRRGHVDLDDETGLDGQRRLRPVLTQADVAVADEPLHLRSRERRHVPGDDDVEPGAGVGVIGGETMARVRAAHLRRRRGRRATAAAA